MKYFISINDNQNGPYDKDELLSNGLTRDSLVWTEGMEDWNKAGEVEDLKHLFGQIPPPINKNIPPKPTIVSNPVTNNSTNSKKGVFIGLGLALVIGSVILFAMKGNDEPITETNKEEITAIDDELHNSESNDDSYDNTSYSNNTNTNSSNSQRSSQSQNRQQTEEQIQAALRRKEEASPKDHLSMTYSLSYKVLSGKDEIRGTIYNTATFAAFQDVSFNVIYKTQTGTVLGTESFTVYDYVYPSDDLPFSLKVYSPDGTKVIGVQITGAKVANFDDI
jgi:hypothetical protein